MKTVKAIIERGNNGTYGIYMDNEDLNYGLIGDGNTVDEAIVDFYNSYTEMKKYYEEENKYFEDVEFIFKYDIASFLQYYSNKFSLSGLEAITGVNQRQLSHYVTGHRKPSEKTIKKIENSLHNFGTEISQVEFV